MPICWVLPPAVEVVDEPVSSVPSAVVVAVTGSVAVVSGLPPILNPPTGPSPSSSPLPLRVRVRVRVVLRLLLLVVAPVGRDVI